VALRTELERRQARLVDLERGRYQHPRRTYLAFDTPSGRVHAHYSTKPEDEPLFAHEVAVRKLVGDEGPLRAPRVLAHGPNWLLAGTVEPESLRPPVAVDRIVAAALRIAELELPPSPWPKRPGGRLGVIGRRLRLLRTPLPARDVVAARTIVADCPLPLVTSHGSYQRNHVFLADGAAWVIDWEHSGKRPLGYDLMHFWSNLEDPELRDLVFARTVEAVGSPQELELKRLRYALLVRMIAGKFVDDAQPESARRLLAVLPAIREDAR
jgi:Phosphotransferase enzyme family